ncbi:pyridoxal phosphate-dependent decarboxylase family protein [Pedococcus bigeumensis]|uniref:Aspartate aminotransferase family protein n=1 Tax=Pedococcus bigeumensis TaxID=433644 RepID=A0A502CQS0_9MICO|nr:aminotransferase class V-fold PLP-dependent enzyme [Pedococcus bigeumensis]TPG15092.1 aspartate aminotransferase family protein [Pedococcus bigeumensis]
MGLPVDEVVARLEAMRSGDLPTHGGRTLAYVYDSGLADADELGRRALAMFASANGLDPTAFPSLLQMEQELVGFAGRLLDAPEGFVGTATSGGTESILLAVQTARDARPEVDQPRMVLPTTVHAAFHKAAHYFGVEPVFVPVDPGTFRADAEAMAAAIDDRTVLVVASAPSYAHGVIDPVTPIAAAALAAGARCHVDACIGGWVLPYLRRQGADQPDWTFAVEGVTSISVDLHKYAYTPKGVSLLLHRSAWLRRPQLFAAADWPGYTMLNTTTQSTKSGGPLAAAWAVVTHLGDDGYAALAEQVGDGIRELVDGLAVLPELAVVARPDSTLVALRADDSCDVFTICDEMLLRGWFVQPQMAFAGEPPTMHLTLSAATAPLVPEFLAALGESVSAAVAAGPVQVAPELAAAASAIDPATLDDAAFDGLLQVAGLAGADGALALPERMAPVNALLNVAPPRLREALLVTFLDRLSRPRTQ